MEFELDGRAIRYANGGREHDPALPGVVMIHGAGMNRTAWQLQTRFLAHHGYRVAAVDLPGHGGSDGPPLESIGEMADWVIDVVGALDIGPAHLVGHSMGTYIAMEAAARSPESVRSVVLIGTAAAMPVHPELLDSAYNDISHAGQLMTSWGFGAKAHIGRHATPGMWLLGGSTALIDVSPEGALGADMAACNAYDGALAAAAEVTCPVTFILGALDKMTPTKRAAELQSAFSNSRTVLLDGIGHMLPAEAPDATREAIVEALALAEGSVG